MEEYVRCQTIEIFARSLCSERSVLDSSLLPLELSSSEDMAAAVAIENGLGEMFMTFVVFVAVVQPGWSTNASEARMRSFVESFLAGHTQIAAIDTIMQLPDSCAMVGVEHDMESCMEIKELG
jgi:SRSO17 transposase